MPRIVSIVVWAAVAVATPCEPAPMGGGVPVHRAVVLANDLLQRAVEHRHRGDETAALGLLGEAGGHALALEREGFPLTARRIEILERWSPVQVRLAVETWARLETLEADPVHASPDELTEILGVCRDLGDRWCEARSLLERAECLHQSLPVPSAASDASAAEAILREAGNGSALGRAVYLAGDRHEEALRLARLAGDRSLEGRALCSIALRETLAGNSDAAGEIVEQIRGLETGLPRVAGCRAYDEGLGLLFGGKPSQARETWDRFADSEIAAQAPRERILVLNAGTVVSFTALSDLEGAVARGRRARALADRLPGMADRARSYVNLTSALAIAGRFHEIEEIALMGLELSRGAGIRAGEAICLKSLGNAAHARGDYGTALERCRESLELSVRGADRFYALVCIGGALESLGEQEEAKEAIRQAISLADGIGDVPMRAHGRSSLARIHHVAGDSKRAEELANEALELLGPEGNTHGRAWALKTRGMARTGLQRHTLAHDDLRESFRLFETMGNVEAQAHVAIELGNVQYYLNRPDRALDYYEQAAELGRRSGATEAEIIALGNIALSRRRFGLTSEIRGSLLQQARAIGSPQTGALGANAMLNLAEALNEIGEAAAAEGVASRALDLPAVRESKAYLARAHRSLASARSGLERHREAISECRAALDLSGEVGPRTAISLHWACGNVFLDGGRPAEGLESLRKAVRIGEGARAELAQPAFRASFLSDRTDMYADLVRAVLSQESREPPAETVEEALEISERFRSWTLLDALAGVRARPGEPERRGELLADMARIHLDMMSASPDRRAEMLSGIRRLEDRLAATTLQPNSRLLGGSRGIARDLPALLPDDETAFLEYLLGYRAAYVFVVTRDGIRVAELPGNRDELRHDIRGYRALIRRRDPDLGDEPIRTVGERLYRSLFAPVEEILDDAVRRLVICPDDALHFLPFDALLVPGDRPDDPVRYLVEDYQVTVVPSLGVYTQLRRNGSPAPGISTLAAFADPETSAAYAPLPYSEEEVRLAARRIGGDARIYTRGEATEENARNALAGGHRVVHFAGHGFLDAGSLGRSGLVLSPDPAAGDDGLLQARELVDLQIGADLVILSGCSTGGGRLVPGEGPMGLPHALFQAGAPSILMTLWDVRDRGAAVFMDRFYAGLARERTFGEALRAAKRDLIASGRAELRHPSVWAPFVMAGVADARMDLPGTRPAGKRGVYPWSAGLVALSFFLWILSALLRRRSRSEPPGNGR